MKIYAHIFLTLALSITLAASEYPRMKLRGPPRPPGPPPPISHAKKWQNPPRGPIRGRPIPVHMPSQHKAPPMGPMKRPSAPPPPPPPPPMRSGFWNKNGPPRKIVQQNYVPLPPGPQGPLLDQSLQHSIKHQISGNNQHQQIYFPNHNNIVNTNNKINGNNNHEYDFHIQTNNIPYNGNGNGNGNVNGINNYYGLIKQVGEKGPIHTIPAPNLSLADKPIVVEDVKHYNPETTAYVQIQKSHSYQVTELPEGVAYQQHQQQSLGNRPQDYLMTQDTINQQQQQELQLQQQQFHQHHHQQQQQQELQQQEQFHQHHQQQQQQQQQELQQQQEQFHQQQQQQELQQQQQQQQFHQQQIIDPQIYMHLLPQDPAAPPQHLFLDSPHQILDQPPQTLLFQPDHDYLHQLQIATDKVGSGGTSYPSNQEEVPNQNQEPRGAQTVEGDEVSQTQSRYVQDYFQNPQSDRQEEVVNQVEPEAIRPSPEEETEEEETTEGFFSSLPNKEAADVLASLQEAGKLNNNLNQMLSRRNNNNKNRMRSKMSTTTMKIMVDDDEVEERGQRIRHEYDEDDEYSRGQEDAIVVPEPGGDSFGHRIRPKH